MLFSLPYANLMGLFFFAFMIFGLSCKNIATKKSNRDLFRLEMTAKPQATGQCLMSLLGPASQNCLQWEANVDASPTYEPSRRLILTGAGDAHFHVLDADLGYLVTDIKTQGRVITKTIFSPDRTIMYFGTDKGIIYGVDAFSYRPLFLFTADSQINNNLTIAKDALVFTSSLGSIYCLDQKKGSLRWQIKQPLSAERLRLASNSTIYVYEEPVGENKRSLLFVPHADAYISVIDAVSGAEESQITLANPIPNGFPDIVAPMIRLRNRLWVASYDLGLFGIDLTSRQVQDHIDLKEVTELTTDGQSLFAATPHALSAFSEIGRLIWANDLKEVKSRATPTTYSFKDGPDNSRRLFFGRPSRVLTDHLGVIVVAFSGGSIGIFDKASGQLRKILGNSVGFGPKIDWAGPTSFVVMSKRGLLMKFEFADGKSVFPQTATFFRPLKKAWSGGDGQ